MASLYPYFKAFAGVQVLVLYVQKTVSIEHIGLRIPNDAILVGDMAQTPARFRLQGDSVNKDFSMGKPVWHWPLEESPRHSPRHDSNKDWLRKRAPKYNCVPAMPLLEILMSQETEVLKFRVWGARDQQASSCILPT